MPVLERTPRAPWAVSGSEVIEALNAEAASGLSKEEAARRLAEFGRNVIEEEPRTSRGVLLFRQFQNPVVLTLIVATVLCGVLGEWVDALAIAAILAVNAAIGYLQEFKAEEAVSALKRAAAPRARVLRSGGVESIASEHVCRGDILVLEAGDWIPADARVLISHQLSTDESLLTGESTPVRKKTDPIAEGTPLSDRSNMMFGGTTVAAGSGRAVVTATGMNTEIGRIARLLERSHPGPTPLQRRLAQLGRVLLVICLLVAGAVAILALAHGDSWLSVIMTSVSLAVASIPEGLPTVVTIALAIAVHRMAGRNAIVRHLPAVETLGSTDVICADKTGTLTTGKMRVREVVLDRDVLPASDETLARRGSFVRMARVAALCGNASIGDSGPTGDPTEVALLLLARDHGIDLSGFEREAEWPFDSVRKRMSVSVRWDGDLVLCVKGAPESVLPLCRTEPAGMADAIDALSSRGRRLLAVACRNLDRAAASDAEAERDLDFLGLVSIADPPRPETPEAIRSCQEAGIRVVMITGDHPKTAKAVAEELGIAGEVISGPELDAWSEREFEEKIERVAVFARVTPEHKLSIVRSLKKRGRIVAMTGDGVNDAPALKEATIGVSMGRGGTEVARQASAMILTDDHFATIVSAIEEGRAIYGNIRRTIQYLLGGNFAEIFVMLGAAVAGWPTALAPVHLLWINLVTDGFPALALAVEPVPKKGLRASPFPSTKFTPRFFGGMLAVGTVVGILTLTVYGVSLRVTDEAGARANAFSFLVFEELFRSFAMRSEVDTFFAIGWRSNLYLLVAVLIPVGIQLAVHHLGVFAELFKVHPISIGECAFFMGLALIPVTILEVRKLVRHRYCKKGDGGPR